MVTNAPFGRAARGIVLHAVAFKTAYPATVHPNGERNRQHPLRVFDHGSNVFMKPERIRRDVEVVQSNLVGVLFCGDRS